MILIWHNSEYLEFQLQEVLGRQLPKEVLKDSLTPVAWVNTSELGLAWQLTLNTNGSLPNLPKVRSLLLEIHAALLLATYYSKQMASAGYLQSRVEATPNTTALYQHWRTL